ncbi:hypothetical protein T492DRAFT_982778 [Pavlovales sp. CCMP2436]|nr:hypothetical protein T492DRAFT_982778 [Pavlovales sp. CCMP2436]
MYVFGGDDVNNASLNDLWEYALDTRAWTHVLNTTESAPFPRSDPSLVPLGNRLVVFGGYNYAIESYEPALHCFDLQRRRWSDFAVGGEHPHARTSQAAIPCGGGFLIFGWANSSDEVFFNDTFLLRGWL